MTLIPCWNIEFWDLSLCFQAMVIQIWLLNKQSLIPFEVRVVFLCHWQLYPADPSRTPVVDGQFYPCGLASLNLHGSSPGLAPFTECAFSQQTLNDSSISIPLSSNSWGHYTFTDTQLSPDTQTLPHTAWPPRLSFDIWWKPHVSKSYALCMPDKLASHGWSYVLSPAGTTWATVVCRDSLVQKRNLEQQLLK